MIARSSAVLMQRGAVHITTRGAAASLAIARTDLARLGNADAPRRRNFTFPSSNEPGDELATEHSR